MIVYSQEAESEFFWHPYYEKTINPIKILHKNEFQDVLQDYVKNNFFYIYNETKKLKFRNTLRNILDI